MIDDEVTRMADKLDTKKAARHPLIKFAIEIHNRPEVGLAQFPTELEFEAIGELSDYDLVLVLRELYELKNK